MGRRWLATLLAFLWFVPATAEVAIPDTPAGRAFQLWLRVMNDPNPALIQRYNEVYHRGLTPEAVEFFHMASDGYTVEKIEESSQNKLVAIVTERDSGAPVRRTFALDPADPSRFIDASGVALPVPRLSQRAALEAASKRADYFAAHDFFSGGILIAQDGKILVQRTWGLADRDTQKPVTPDTQFRVGSMDKMFTATAILQLVRQKKLSLDGTVGNYLPDYPNKEIASRVTIRMLLSHTGGTGDIFGPEFDAHRLSLKENADYVALYGGRSPEFPPGTQDRYSNYGFVLLGDIIQTVTGISYYDYVQRHILDPAKMNATGFLPEDIVVKERSVGYMRKSGVWISNADTLPWRGTAADGGYSTLGDMLKFAEALQSGILLPADLVQEVTSPQNHAKDYGFGFEIKDVGTLREYGHMGGAPGMNGDLRVYPELGRVVVVFTNLDPSTANWIADYYEQRMPLET